VPRAGPGSWRRGRPPSSWTPTGSTDTPRPGRSLHASPRIGLVPLLALLFTLPLAISERRERSGEPVRSGHAAFAASSLDLGADALELIIYSGRSRELVAPILEQFDEENEDIVVRVRYGETAQLAALILEEGQRSPADVFFAQDAGALGALVEGDRLVRLPDALLERVPESYRSPDGWWTGVTGRARAVVYNTNRVNPADLPDSIIDFTDPTWKGRLGWAPTNGSFQAFVTAMRVRLGEERTAEWLRGIRANEPKVYPKNSVIVRAVGAGEVDAGFVNHYYLYRFLAEDPDFPAENYYTPGGDVGSLVNVAGIGLVAGRDADDQRHHEASLRLARHLLSEHAQRHFARETYEYPLIGAVEAADRLTPLAEIDPPDIDLSDLRDLRGTLRLLRETGVLP